jgi:hypothetical protein
MESRAGKSWYPDEDGQLINEYKYGTYTVEQIAVIHKRPVEQIERRLRMLQHVFAKKFKTQDASVKRGVFVKTSSLPNGKAEATVRSPNVPKLVTRPVTAVRPVTTVRPVTAGKHVTVLEPLLEVDDTVETTNETSTSVEVNHETPVPHLLKISDYTCAGDAWTNEESDKLLALYKDRELGLMAISALHKRTPASIVCKLRKMNIELVMSNVRGYDEYKLSPLYKEVLGVRKQKK